MRRVAGSRGRPNGGYQNNGDANGGAYDPRQYNRELQERLNEARDTPTAAWTEQSVWSRTRRASIE